jgi:two-component system, NarL family, nitrate/nitrite response regulator NarL
MSSPPTCDVSVVLVDQHGVVRSGIRVLIEQHLGWSVAGEAATAADALREVVRHLPHVIILDLDLGGDSGLELLPKLVSAAPHARILVLTAIHDSHAHQQALRRGASGIVLKEQDGDVLINALDKVQRGEVWLDRGTIAAMFEGAERAVGDPVLYAEFHKINALTTREREVITFVCEGLKNKQIAERLSISETTVRHHLTSIFNKVGVTDRLELAIYAYRFGLAPLPR